MRLIRQIIQKKYSLFLEDLANKEYNYWSFFQVVNLITAFEGKRMSVEIKAVLTKAWKNAVSGINVEKNLLIIQRFVEANQNRISEFLKQSEALEEQEATYGNLYEKGRGIIGVLGGFDSG